MRTRAITDRELRALRLALPWRDGLAMQIMRDTGLRVSDMLRLTVADLERPSIRVVERKTGKLRVVHLRPSTRRELRRYVQGRPAAAPLIACNRSTLYRSIHDTALRLGMRRISAHSARKAYARAYARKHGAEATRRELRHDSIATTLLYLQDV